jgi:hypothetical protein
VWSAQLDARGQTDQRPGRCFRATLACVLSVSWPHRPVGLPGPRLVRHKALLDPLQPQFRQSWGSHYDSRGTGVSSLHASASSQAPDRARVKLKAPKCGGHTPIQSFCQGACVEHTRCASRPAGRPAAQAVDGPGTNAQEAAAGEGRASPSARLSYRLLTTERAAIRWGPPEDVTAPTPPRSIHRNSRAGKGAPRPKTRERVPGLVEGAPGRTLPDGVERLLHPIQRLQDVLARVGV